MATKKCPQKFTKVAEGALSQPEPNGRMGSFYVAEMFEDVWNLNQQGLLHAAWLMWWDTL